MMKKRIKQGGALILMSALMFSTLILPKTYAADSVDTNAQCSLEINMEDSSYSEVRTLPLTVNLYKVADIKVSGEYTAAAGLSTLDFSGISHTSTAADWESLAAAAKAEVTEKVIESGMKATATGTTENGSVIFDGLATGLYLVDAQQLISDHYQYDFTPYLISLPNNYYYGSDSGDDSWVYDLSGSYAISLKPERTDRYGDLVINKSLEAYNESLGAATFIFQIEATKTDVDTEEAQVVYSDVVSMTFESAGTDSLTVQDIPAGAVVTVTEIYSGASYVVTSDATQTVTILAEADGESPVEVGFVNTLVPSPRGGRGIVNHFAYDSETEAWTHSATDDSTP